MFASEAPYSLPAGSVIQKIGQAIQFQFPLNVYPSWILTTDTAQTYARHHDNEDSLRLITVTRAWHDL